MLLYPYRKIIRSVICMCLSKKFEIKWNIGNYMEIYKNPNCKKIRGRHILKEAYRFVPSAFNKKRGK